MINEPDMTEDESYMAPIQDSEPKRAESEDVRPEKNLTIIEAAESVNRGEWGDNPREALAKAGYNPTTILMEAERQNNPDGPKSFKVLVDEVIAGEWGEGYERRKRLFAAGYSPTIVELALEQQNSK